MARSYQSDRENWLVRYLSVQKIFDGHVTSALIEAMNSAEKATMALEAKTGVGAAVRRTQLLRARAAISDVLASLYGRIGEIVRSGQKEAASAALLAELDSAKRILEVIEKDAAKRKILERSLDQSARRNVQTMMTRILGTQKPLSKRLYQSRALSNGQISKVINNHLARGSSAAELAKDVKEFFNPGVPGGASSRARTLARTEINNAFHAQSIADMQDRPWVNNVKWNLSKSHPAKQPYDKCDEYARIGLFPPEHIPPKPHPNCLCFVVPDLPDINSVINDYLAGKYDSWIAENMDDDMRRSA